MPIDFECKLAATPIPLSHAWEHTVGSGRALLALRADWREHLRRARIDLGFRHVRHNANPRRAWQEIGEPDYASPRQVETLHAASALCPKPHPLRVTEGSIHFDLVIPPQAVAALAIELAPSQSERAPHTCRHASI